MNSTYSDKSLKDKLGLSPEMSTYFLRAPAEYWQELGFKQARYNDIHGEYDFIHAFFSSKEVMSEFAEILAGKLSQDGIMWISWPKKSDIPDDSSDLSEQGIKDVFLALGLDNSQMSDINESWSGLKFVWPSN